MQWRKAGLKLAAAAVALMFGGTAIAADKISVRLEWSWWIVHAAYFVAMDKGYYKDSGLEVEVNQGKGSMSTATLVGQGTEKIGFGDAGAAARVITQGGPMTVVAVLWQSGPLGLLCRQEVGLKKPSDIEGKSVGSAASTADAQQLAAFIAMNRLQGGKIQVVNMPAEAKLAALLEGRVNCISADVYLMQSRLEKTNLKTDSLLYADNGVVTLSNTIMVTNEFLAKNPDLVRRYVAATLRGYQYMLDHPDEAVVALKNGAPDAIINPAADKNYIGIMKRQARTAASAGKPLGWSAEADWATLLEVLQKYGGLKDPKPPSAYFTNDYLPKS